MKSLLHYSLIIEPHHSIKAKIPHVLCKTSKPIIMVQPAWVLFDCLEFEARNRKLHQNISKYLPIDVLSYPEDLNFFQRIWENFLGYCISVFILFVFFSDIWLTFCTKFPGCLIYLISVCLSIPCILLSYMIHFSVSKYESCVIYSGHLAHVKIIC